MKRVGECVGREPAGSSLPRADSEPPITLMSGETVLQRVVGLGEQLEVGRGSRTFEPSGPNCGSQKRFRFGSLPTMMSRTPGSRRGIDAA